jgi:hypothetical protein
MSRVEIHMKIFRKMKSTLGIQVYLKILKDYKKTKEQEDLQWSPPTQRQ